MTTLTSQVLSPLGLFRSRVGQALSQELASLRGGLARREVYRKSFCALQAQSDRDLAGQGVARRDIADIARDRARAVTLP